MSKIIDHFVVELDASLDEEIRKRIFSFSSYRILRKSVDARRGRPKFIYRLEVFREGESSHEKPIQLERLSSPVSGSPVLIVGSGPAGLFSALRLVERGIPCILFERGSMTTKRLLGITQYWRYGNLVADNNVCFGEGGAGLYSDGKLITRIKSPYIPYVIDRLVSFGAPEEIKYLSNPHVGSDRIRKLIPPLRNYLLANNCQIFFDTKVNRLLFEDNRCIGVETSKAERFLSEHTVLATGHSAFEVYQNLEAAGVKLEGKSFALGLRVEHSQQTINKIQYKSYAEHPALGAANYRVSHYDPDTQIGAYSFCMCPGGYVVASSTECDGVVSNGMSNYARNSPFANSAIVVSIDFEKRFAGETFAGLNFIREIEKRAFSAVKNAGGTKELPGQGLIDFLKRKKSALLQPNSSPSKAVSVELHKILPMDIYERLCESLEIFNQQMPGFISSDVQLFGIESRTSAPLRIPRDEHSLQSVSHQGLYPCGEGAGYAGGITSAAVDGVRVAESIYHQLSGKTNTGV